MQKKLAIITGMLILTVIVAAGCPAALEPAKPADFYKGKTIDFVINESAGSFPDLIARIIVSYLGRDTGAKVIPTNRRGAGGMEGMNYLYKSEPDGLTLGAASVVKSTTNKVLDDPAAEYKIDEFSYIMSVGRRPNYFFVSPEGPYQSVADLQAGKDIKLAGGSASGYVCLAGLTVIKLLNLDAKVITGFSGDSNRALAVKRGEVTGYVINLSGAADYIEAGMVKPMFVLDTERNPLTPDVPAITELVSITDEDLALVKLWGKLLVGSTLFAAPPAIPEDRLSFLRELVNQWAQDEEFREEISTVSNYDVQDYEYIAGEEVTELILEMAANLDEFQAIFDELIEKYRA